MSERRRIEFHRRGLSEIREIVGSMKSLAYIETRRLERRVAAQRAVAASIAAAATDVVAHNPEAAAGITTTGPPTQVVIGSERGFCGDLNHALVRHLEEHGAASGAHPKLIVVGHKLEALLEHDERVASFVEGPGSVEEIGAALGRLVAALDRVQPARGAAQISAVYHSSRNEVVTRTLLPAFQAETHVMPADSGPLLNLDPGTLLLDLTDQYLFAALHEILLAALAAENQRRIEHLEGAVRHLDDRLARLGRRLNALRQEEIIEEIEVILLSAEPPRSGARPR